MFETKPLLQRVKVMYFSDPVCSTCWIVDPYIKKLLQEYGSVIDLEIIMGGLLDSWENFCGGHEKETQSFLCDLWTKESSKFNIRLDASVWMEKPIASSIPASIAYYAAEFQGIDQAKRYIRNLREHLFLRGHDISERRHLITAAVECGLNVAQFIGDLDNGRAREVFDRRQNDKRMWSVLHYPTLIFVNENGDVERGKDPIDDFSPAELYADWERILDKLTDGNSRKIVRTNTVSDILRKFERLSFYELAALTGLNEHILKQQIEMLYREGILIKEKHGGVNYYRTNNTPYYFKKDGFQFENPALIGAGVCGRYITKLLNLSNIKPNIIERQQKDAFKGFGFIILKNGIDALDAVGLKNELLRKSNTINFFKAINPEGQILFEKILDNCLAITREDYYDLIEGSIEEMNIAYETEAIRIDFNENNQLCEIQLSNGNSLQADVFFAADGIRSKLRTQLFPNSILEIQPEREIVGSAYLPDLDLPKDEFLKVIDIENGKNMGILPLANGHYIWFLQLNADLSPVHDSSPEGLKNYLKESTANLPEAFKLMAEHSDYTKAFLWTANRMDLLPAFHHQNLAFLGDAAHPLLAFTSQGANSALEDAAYLFSMLSFQQPDETYEDIFKRYYEIRKDAIAHHIKEGDSLLENFLNMKSNPYVKLPLSVH
jgi:2-polyprenyl-6-methoxyphenol hydroxylase-like FAD-dependent oxidoreductase/predicted DsbA family dithiol-disulfide isomerase/predicted transcriptional regulator